MHTSKLLAGFVVLCLTQVAVAGGPDLRSRAATVDHVTADQSKIVMILSGPCEVFLADLGPASGKDSARMVETDLKNCVITIVRRDEKGSGYTSWKEHCELAKSLVGKQAYCELHGTITIDSARVSAVHATASALKPVGVASARTKP